MSPPGKRIGPAWGPDRIEESRGGKKLDTTVTLHTDAVPLDHPWHGRPDAHEVERRFAADRDGWRRRIRCARRLSHDARDELVAPAARWTP
jgi:hypothetical protein